MQTTKGIPISTLNSNGSLVSLILTVAPMRAKLQLQTPDFLRCQSASAGKLKSTKLEQERRNTYARSAGKFAALP